MATLTNVLNLPAPLVEAVRRDSYDAGRSDITVTSLISPPQKVALERAHAGEIVEDASDRIWALLGQVVHGILERYAADHPDYSSEERVFCEVNGWAVSGQYDLMFTNERGERVLQDFKFVSIWEAMNGPKEDRHQQLNLLAEILRRNGTRVDRLEVLYIFRDWSKQKARLEENYPDHQVLTYFVPMWPEEKAAAYLEERVALHQRAQAGDLIPCTDEDRWAKPTTFAVRKEKNKRASRVLLTYDEAFTWASQNNLTQTAQFGEIVTEELKGAVIEERPGEQTRCLSYCSAASWCTQWAGLQMAGAGAEEEAA